MEGRGCEDVIQGRNRQQMLPRGGNPGHEEREREGHRGSYKENTSQKPLTGYFMSFFLNQQGSQTGVLEVHGEAGMEP